MASALSSASMVWALETHVVIPDTQIDQISPEGKYAAGCNSDGTVITLIDIATGAISTIENAEDMAYSLGEGNYVSDNGILVATDSNGLAVFYSNGVWNVLPLGSDDVWSAAQGITPDGERICGTVSRQDNFTVPVIWSMNGNGQFGEPVTLPYPEKDFTGREPQQCTANWISADGKLVAGEYTDYSGEVILPIIFQENGGQWSYKLLWDANPNNIDLGNPVPYPQAPTIDKYASEATLAAYQEAYDAYKALYDERPLYIDFVDDDVREELVSTYGEWILTFNYTLIMDYLTDEQLAAYEAALAEWEAALEALGGYPELTNYMTAEELAAYNAAQDAYTAQCEAYFDWMEMVYELEEAIPQFSSNNQCLSAQGQFLAAQAIKLDWNTGLYECGLYLFDIEANTFDTFTFYNIDYLSTFVNDEGYMLASSPINYIDMPANAYIRKPGSKTFQLLQDYVNERNPEAYKWMEQKMSHEYYIYDEKGREVGTEGLNTGLACASADLSLIGMCMENYWDQGASENEFSYIVDMNNTEAGISAVEVDPAEIEVYDLNGRRMPSNIDLVPGIYIVKQGNTVRKIRY